MLNSLAVPCRKPKARVRTLTTVWNVLDFMAFFPPLLETALLYGAKLSFSLGRFDLRWFKILRCWPIHMPRLRLCTGLNHRPDVVCNLPRESHHYPSVHNPAVIDNAEGQFPVLVCICFIKCKGGNLFGSLEAQTVSYATTDNENSRLPCDMQPLAHALCSGLI